MRLMWSSSCMTARMVLPSSTKVAGSIEAARRRSDNVPLRGTDILSRRQYSSTPEVIDRDALGPGRRSLDVIGHHCRVSQSAGMQARLDPTPPHLVRQRRGDHPVILFSAFAVDDAALQNNALHLLEAIQRRDNVAIELESVAEAVHQHRL